MCNPRIVHTTPRKLPLYLIKIKYYHVSPINKYKYQPFFQTIVKITDARPISSVDEVKFWKCVLTNSGIGPWIDEWTWLAVEWGYFFCFMICCKVQMISGGSAGEADKTKSWVLGIALKRSRHCIPYYCIPEMRISWNLSKSTKEKELAKMFTAQPSVGEVLSWICNNIATSNPFFSSYPVNLSSFKYPWKGDTFFRASDRSWKKATKEQIRGKISRFH